MTILNTVLLQAAAGGGSSMSGLILIVAMIVIFYFFMIRPQKKQQKKIKEQRDALRPGDKVVTSGGIHGRLKEIDDNIFMVEVDKGVVLKMSRESVYPAVDAAPAKEKKDDNKKAQKEEKAQD